MPHALPLCLVLLSETCIQAKASPVPHNFRPFKDSPSGCLTVIFFLVLSLTILFVLKKIYVARRRKIDPVPIFPDQFSVPISNRKGGSSMTKDIAKRSGFYVGLLGSPGWETKRSVLIGGGPGHISLPPESRIPSCRHTPSGSSTTTVLHKVPARCEITRPAPGNVLEDKPLHVVVLSSELSRPPPAMVLPKLPGSCLDAKSSLRAMCLSSLLITQDDQHGDFQSNENIALNLGPRNSTLVSGLNSTQSRIDHSKSSPVSSFVAFKDKRRLSGTCDSSAANIAIPTHFRTSTKHARSPIDLLENSIQQSKIKPLHFNSISKRCAHDMSENSKQLCSDDANDSSQKIAPQDFSNVSPLKVSHKIPDSPRFCRQFVDLSSNSARLKAQYSTPYKRARNSPIIGPSPLRTMSLPSDYDLEHTKKFNVSTASKIQSEVTSESSIHSPPSTSHFSPISRRSKTALRPDDPDIIIDLIRELAQETSEWDASLFLDEKFKAMLDQSKIYPSCKLKIKTAQEKRSKCRRERRTTSFIPLQDIPESEVATMFSEGNHRHPDEAQSFWEDEIDVAYQYDVQPQPPSLGTTY